MIYGYARVSTNGQAKDGNSLESQHIALKNAGAHDDTIFSDRFTGTKKHRPQFDVLMSKIQSGDTLGVTKLDRIARSAMHGTEIITELLSKGITVNVLNMGIMDDTPTGKLIRAVFFAFAEFERDMIVERTSEGKAIAKQKPDFSEGRPRKVIPNFQNFLEKQKDGVLTVSQCCEQLNISRSVWYNRCRKADQI